MGVTVTFMDAVTVVDAQTSPKSRARRYPGPEVSNGLIFDFGLPPLWRALQRLWRARRSKRYGHLASG